MLHTIGEVEYGIRGIRRSRGPRAPGLRWDSRVRRHCSPADTGLVAPSRSITQGSTEVPLPLRALPPTGRAAANRDNPERDNPELIEDLSAAGRQESSVPLARAATWTAPATVFPHLGEAANRDTLFTTLIQAPSKTMRGSPTAIRQMAVGLPLVSTDACRERPDDDAGHEKGDHGDTLLSQLAPQDVHP
jgi:hypothetical protein